MQWSTATANTKIKATVIMGGKYHTYFMIYL